MIDCNVDTNVPDFLLLASTPGLLHLISSANPRFSSSHLVNAW